MISAEEQDDQLKIALERGHNFKNAVYLYLEEHKLKGEVYIELNPEGTAVLQISEKLSCQKQHMDVIEGMVLEFENDPMSYR